MYVQKIFDSRLNCGRIIWFFDGQISVMHFHAVFDVDWVNVDVRAKFGD